jgi:hypothetical protein
VSSLPTPWARKVDKVSLLLALRARRKRYACRPGHDNMPLMRVFETVYDGLQTDALR